MTDTPRSGPAPDRAKQLFILVILALAVPALWADEAFWFQPAHPHWDHIRPFLAVLTLHIVGGVVALVVGAFQFSSHLRRARPDIHRLMGKTYLAATALGGPSALYIQILNAEGAFQWAAYAHSVTWMLATAMAFWCVRLRDFDNHRLWMMRSYAMCLLFITLRAPDAIPGFHLDDAGNTALEFGQIFVALLGIEVVESVRRNRKLATKRAGRQ
jgi:uncharacterized membrane protein